MGPVVLLSLHQCQLELAVDGEKVLREYASHSYLLPQLAQNDTIVGAIKNYL